MTNSNTMAGRAYQPGQIPSDLDKLENLDDWEIADGEIDPRGFALIGRDGDKIGTIENLLASPTTQQAHFAIVDTGGWFSHKLFLVPMDYLRFGDSSASGPFTKEQFRKAPEWHEGDRDYDRYYSYWSAFGAAQPVSGDDREDSGRPAGESGELVIPVVQEEVNVGKRQVERGVRITTRVIEQPVEETVQLHEEHIHVERRPVDRPLANADETAFQESSFEVKATAEEPVVSRQARVVEEVVVDKETTERTETVRDTVRRTNVDVDEEEEVDRTMPQPAQRP